MAQVTAPQAAEIVSASRVSVVRWVNEGLLPAKRRTMRRIVMIDVDDLRRFAENHGYSFDERLARVYGK